MPRSKAVEYGGKVWGSITALAVAHGMRPKLLMRRLQRSVPIARALVAARMPSGDGFTPSRFITVDGHTAALSDWARMTGAPKTRIRNRIDRGDWPVGAAVFSPPTNGKGPFLFVTINGERMTMKQAAARFKVPYLRLWKRRHEGGWTDDELLAPVSPKLRKRRRRR